MDPNFSLDIKTLYSTGPVTLVSWLSPHEKGTLISIYVQPGASTTGISGEHDGRIKIKIKAPPREGEANLELIRFISEILGIAKKNVFLIQGESSRQKVILVELSLSEVLSKIKY